MLRKNPSGHLPQVSPLAYIDPTAIICGRVIVEDFVYVGPYAVIRADELNAAGDMEPIVIGSHSNIQDGVVIHSKSPPRHRSRPVSHRRSGVYRFQQRAVQLPHPVRLRGAL
jgi:carbonic anhydrase/acetyltransferase-like protein (isoleucine patch superfamily)